MRPDRLNFPSVLTLGFSARVDHDLELCLVQRHQAQVEARKETGQHQQKDDDDDAQPQGQHLLERLCAQIHGHIHVPLKN